MDPFRDTSLHAAWRADFGHIPLSEPELRHLHDIDGRPGPLRRLLGLVGPVGRLRERRDTPDSLGLQPFMPPV